jgi:hypothetical protein
MRPRVEKIKTVFCMAKIGLIFLGISRHVRRPVARAGYETPAGRLRIAAVQQSSADESEPA